MPAIVGSPGAASASPNNVGTTARLTPALAPGWQPGDLLLCFTCCRLGTATVTTPAGWTSLLNIQGTNGRLVLFGKIAGSSESAPNVDWSGLSSGTSGSPCQAQIAAFNGMFNTIASIVDILGTVENGAASTTVSASGSAITTVTDNDVVLALSTRLDDAGTWSAPAGFTMIAGVGTTSGADFAMGWAYQIKTPAGSVSPADFSLAGGSNFASSGVLIALKPAVPTAPVNTAAPQIFGDAIVGNTLSCGQGTWTSSGGTISYAYQWYRNGVAISGATSNLYFLVQADLSQLIICRVTATNSIGSTDKDAAGVSPGAGPDETLYDDFNRADGSVYAGAQGSTLWEVARLDWDQATLMQVKSNALANPGTSYEQAVTKGVLGPGDWDFVVDCLATAASPGEIAIWFSVSGHGPAAAVNGYAFIGSSLSNYWAIRAYAGGVNQGTLVGPLTHPGGPIVAGDSIWISKRMNTYRVYRKPSGGNWSLVISLTNASYPTGVIAIETSDATVRWDNVRGGPWTGIGPPPTAKVVSIV